MGSPTLGLEYTRLFCREAFDGPQNRMCYLQLLPHEVTWKERSDDFLGLCDILIAFCHWQSWHQRLQLQLQLVYNSFSRPSFAPDGRTAAFRCVRDRPHCCSL